MENVHLVGENDLYSGYDFSLCDDSSQNTPSAPKSLTHSAQRPLTAISSAGYTFTKKETPRTEALQTDNTVGSLALRVREAVDESVVASELGDTRLALEKAKQAANFERILKKEKEAVEPSENIRTDTTLGVLVNLALQYVANERISEAIKTYQYIIKCPTFLFPERFRINLANLFYLQKNYTKAIKTYRMAMDTVPNSHSHLRAKISKNIGNVFLKMGKFKEAISSYEFSMGSKPDPSTGLNLFLCAYFLEDKAKMKDSFNRLLQIPSPSFSKEECLNSTSNEDPSQTLFSDLLKNDALSQWEKKKKEAISRSVMIAARILDSLMGDEWCINQMVNYPELTVELELNKAMAALKKNDFPHAIELLQKLEKEEGRVGSIASTNLSFLLFQQNDILASLKYAEKAIEIDRYNAQSFVNKGNCFLMMGNIKLAIEFYKQALMNESSCVEALYNLGLIHKRYGDQELALDCFFKLYAIFRNYPQILYQISTLYELLGDRTQALEWFQGLAAMVPTDPHLLVKMGEMYDREGDRNMALQYLHDAYRYFPSSLSTIEWLGTYFEEMKFYEKAQKYFEKGAVIDPKNERWRLHVASCMRKSGNLAGSMQAFREIQEDFPQSMECLQILIQLDNREEYREKLRRLESRRLAETPLEYEMFYQISPAAEMLPRMTGITHGPVPSHRPAEPEYNIEDLLP